MKTTVQLWRFTPLVLAAAICVGRSGWSEPSADLRLEILALLAVLGIGAALFRLRGWPSLGMGAVVLPLAIATSGVVAAAVLAVFLLIGRRFLTRLLEREAGETVSAVVADLLLSSGPVALAVLAAGWIGVGVDASGTRVSAAAPAARGLAEPAALAELGGPAVAGIAYVGLFALLSAVIRFEPRGRGGRGRKPLWRELRPLFLDAVGWSAGIVLLLVVTHLGWPAGLVLAGGFAALSGAALRADLRVLHERTISNRLRDVHLAGHRMIFHRPDLLAIAAQIHSECRGVVPFDWFHLELRDPDGKRHHWGAGPDRRIGAGRPEPPPSPERKGRFGRRPAWTAVTRDLSTGDRTLGRIKMWCDPRAVGDGEVDWLDAFLPEVSAAIERAFLNREARRDALTDLPDRRVLENRLEDVFHRSLSRGAPMSVIMVDIDHFKRVNDTHGHAIGDQALVAVTRLIEEQRRDADVCCRYGGEEFALVLEDADGETALAVAERIRAAVERAVFAPEGEPIDLRLSAGVASFPSLPIDRGNRLVELADEALYEAKQRGRNRCLLNLGDRRYAPAAGRPERPRAVSAG